MNDLNSVFTPEVLTKLARIGGKQVPSNGRDIHNRHRILTATPEGKSRGDLLQQATWRMYVKAAFKCGLLPNEDLVGRLQSTNDNDFRSGVSECLSAWYFGGLGFDVKPRPESTSQRNVDLLLTEGDVSIYTEVKAPYEPVPLVGGWAGDDSAALLRCVMDAGKNQLKPGRANLLVICPALRMSVHADREQLLKATIGQLVYEVPISMDGSPPAPGRVAFRQNGKLARWIENKATGAFKTDFTRISAVMTIEPDFAWLMDDDRFEVTHKAVVVHNPFATHKLSPGLFGDIPQWVITGDTMGWNDNYRGP